MTDDTTKPADDSETNSSNQRDRSTVLRNGSPSEGRLLLPDGGESEESEGDSEESDDETGLVHLDLEGLFLDVLGLEVSLNEVVLDVSAVSGPGNLLGNLLSAVGGLLDSSPGSLLGGLLPEDGLSGLVPEAPEIPSTSELLYGGINIVLDAALDALGGETDGDGGGDGGDESSEPSDTPEIDPSEYTITELRDQLESVEDPEGLRAIREAEADGENRTGAIEAINEHLDDDSDDEPEDASAENDSEGGA